MRENIDPNLSDKDKWEKILEEADLPKDLKPTGVPLTKSLMEKAFHTNHPELGITDLEVEKSLAGFETLSSKIQDDILVDLKKRRSLKMPPREILERFNFLVAKGLILKSQELGEITTMYSDVNHEPKLSQEESEKREIDEAIARSVNILITKIERMRQIENQKSKPPETIH